MTTLHSLRLDLQDSLDSPLSESLSFSPPLVSTNCEGLDCCYGQGPIRCIPLDGSNCTHLCQSCYQAEVAYNDALETEKGYRIIPRKRFAEWKEVQ